MKIEIEKFGKLNQEVNMYVQLLVTLALIIGLFYLLWRFVGKTAFEATIPPEEIRETLARKREELNALKQNITATKEIVIVEREIEALENELRKIEEKRHEQDEDC
jgi:hypothetical protein